MSDHRWANMVKEMKTLAANNKAVAEMSRSIGDMDHYYYYLGQADAYEVAQFFAEGRVDNPLDEIDARNPMKEITASDNAKDLANTRAAVDMLVDLVEVQLGYLLSYDDGCYTEERKRHLEFFNTSIQTIRARLHE